MARQRHLKNAPITEALIDFRVKLKSDFDIKKFLSVKADLSNSYPKSEPRRLITGAFGMEKGKLFVQPPKDEGIRGYFYKSEDEKNVVQFRMDGFTFSRMHPYTEWESVISEAKRLWEIYYSIASPEIIERIAVRTINRLDIKLPINDFNEYLVAPPIVPSSLPQAVSQFLTRMVIHGGDKVINLVQAMEPSADESKMTIILDIDVFKVSTSGLDVSSIWSEFEELHELKNKVFFESITEKAAEVYE